MHAPGTRHKPNRSIQVPTLARVAALAAGLTLGVGLATVVLSLAARSALAAPLSSEAGVTGTGGILLAAGSEPSTVYTSFHNANHTKVTSVTVGMTVHVFVDVEGIAGSATGTALVHEYSNADCSGVSAITHAATLSASSVDAVAATLRLNVAGTRSVRVEYTGDSNYAASMGACAKITWTKITPTLVLIGHDPAHKPVESVPFTTTVHPYAIVMGSFEATNYVLFRAWPNGSCSGDNYSFTTAPIGEHDGADANLPIGFDVPGERSFKAHHSGNGSYNGVWSDCVVIKGTRIAPSLSFHLHDEAHDTIVKGVPIGTIVHPAFGVSGDGGKPTGKVTVRLYSDDHCTTLLTSDFQPALISYDESTFLSRIRSTPGVASWRATYEGDGSYKASTSDCLYVVWSAKPHVSLAIHDADHDQVTSITLGTTVHFRAVVDQNYGAATGKVTFTRSTTNCGSQTLIGSGTLSNAVIHDASIDFKPGSTGTFYFHAVYDGNDIYYPAASDCMVLTVKPAPTPSPTSTPTATPHVTPTPTPTVKPTPKPTAKPTASPTPKPTPSAAPTGTVAGETDAPDATAEPGSSAAPSDAPGDASAEPTVEPAASDGPAATGAAASDAPASAAADPSAAPQSSAAPVAGGPTSSGADGGSPLSIVLVAVIALVIVAMAFWFGVAARRRATPAPTKA